MTSIPYDSDLVSDSISDSDPVLDSDWAEEGGGVCGDGGGV